jgi:Flp pilus assembly protein TadG
MNTRRTKTEERGQTMVEFAIVLPLLLLVLFAILQFGVVFKDYIALTDAVRVGARKASVSREVPDPVGTSKAAVVTAGVNLNLSTNDVQLTYPSGAPWSPGSDVTVTATHPYSINILGVVVGSGRLSSSTTERVE